MEKPALQKDAFQEACLLLKKARERITSVIIGKNEAVELALAAFLAQGHVLLEDLPGTGKTTLAKTVARTLGCRFNRIQFTPDLMPSDITGMNYYNLKSGEFAFRPGPLLTNILLADEINRATPRTQSALLEAMEEKQVTIDGVTYPLRQPFIVLATQNPVDTEGTFVLPWAQQDRFLLKIRLGYPQRAEELKILHKHAFGNMLDSLEPVLDENLAHSLQEITPAVFMEASLHEYILDIVEATRQNEALELALSPRASLSMVRAAKALALLKGRDYVLPDDIKGLCLPVFSHRLKLRREEKYKKVTAAGILQQLINRIPIPVNKAEQ